MEEKKPLYTVYRTLNQCGNVKGCKPMWKTE